MKATLYEALGVPQGASDEEVRAALRRLIRKYYAITPDGGSLVGIYLWQSVAAANRGSAPAGRYQAYGRQREISLIPRPTVGAVKQ